MSDLIGNIIVVVIYLMAVGYLGYRGYRRTQTAADYLLAGREAHPFVMAMSYGATFISTSAIVGFGGVAAMFGMSLLWLTFLNIFVGIFIAFVCLGGPTRRMGHHLDAHTFPELLGKRYDSTFIQVFAGLVIFLFIPLYAAAVLIGGCEFIATSFNMSYDVALLVFSIIIAAYVVMGGLKGVMYTDALQGTIMFVGMIVLLIWCYVSLGGVNAAHAGLAEIGKEPSLFGKMGFRGWTSMPEFGWGDAKYDLWWIVISTIVLGVGIGVLAQPQLVVRFMTVRSKRELNRAVLVGGVFILIMTGVAFTVGSLSNLYFRRYEKVSGKLLAYSPQAMVIAKKERGINPKTGGDVVAVPCHLLHLDTTGDGNVDRNIVYGTPAASLAEILPKAKIEELGEGKVEDLLKQTITVRPQANAFTRSVVEKGKDPDGNTIYAFNPDSIIPTYIKSAMPWWFGLLFLLTLLAAAMSTLSSQFHAVGTSIGRDVYEQVTGQHGKSVGVTRVGVVIGIVIAVIISHYARGGYIVARATAIFFGLCASAFLPAFIGGLFFKRVSKGAAIWSMLVGFIVTALWLLFIKDKEARALGLCFALTGKHSLALGKPNWPVVDPLVVALPLSTLVMIVVSFLTKPMDKGYVAYCYGGPKPDLEDTKIDLAPKLEEKGASESAESSQEDEVPQSEIETKADDE